MTTEEKIDLIVHDLAKLIDVEKGQSRQLNSIQKILDLHDDNMRILEEIKGDITKIYSMLSSLRSHQESVIKDVKADIQEVGDDVADVAVQLEKKKSDSGTKPSQSEKPSLFSRLFKRR